jgi:type I restriction enzyme S subunit
MGEQNNIPKHWQIKELGQVCKLKNGFAFKSVNYTDEGIPVIRISDINGGVVSSNKAVRVIADNEYENYLVENNDILVAMSGATTGKFGIYKSTEKAYQNQRVGNFKILDTNILDKLFLYHQIHSLKRQIEKDAYGGAQPNISSNKIEQMSVVIPPLSEQQAIVSKIEELLSDLENGKQQLLTAQQQLKIYRQSLLKWAFEGKLTNQNVNDGELPKGWKWVKLEDVCKKIGDIDHKMPKQLSSGYPYVSTKDFTDTLKISFDNAKYISEEDYLNLARKIRPERGDIIFPRYGTIGKNILVDFDKEFLVSYSCAVVKPNQKLVISKYVYLYTLSPKITEEIRKYTVETTQANVGIASIKSFVFPFPPLAEQQLIVDELESKLTVCDKIEETISQSLLQAESLRQSILKKAFEGKLI